VSISSSSPLKTVLLVNEKDADRATIKWFLSSFGYTVEGVRSAEEALIHFDPKLHDAVLTENMMHGMNRREMAHVIKLRSSSTPVLMYTELPPQDLSCVDSVIYRPAHLLAVKEELDRLLAERQE